MIYQIKVLGEVDASWSDWFSGLVVTCQVGADGHSITTLEGPLADQATLRGVLVRLWDLNLTLLSVIGRE